MSTENVQRSKWHLALTIFLITLVLGILLLILLALGIADPPRAGELVWQTDTTSSWALSHDTGESWRYIAPIPLSEVPFTLEITAINNGVPASAWGLWLRTTDGLQTFLISNERYMSVGNDDTPHWAQFVHIRTDTNKLYLDVLANQSATFRINDEIAWQGALMPTSDWGIVSYGNAAIARQNIHLYAGK